MRKRIISLLLILALLPMCLAVPAMADETDDDNWVDLLDYGVSNNGTNVLTWTPSDTNQTFYLNYTCPFFSDVKYMDIVFMSDDPDPEVNLLGQSATVVSLGDGLFRAYGPDGRSHNGLYLLSFTVSSGSYLEILRLNVSPVTFQAYNPDISGQAIIYKYPTYDYLVVSGINSQIMWSYSSYDEWDLYRGGFSLFLDVSDWQSLDYIELEVSLAVADITSISATIGSLNVPYEVSYLMDDTSWGFFMVHIRADLTDFDRTLTNDLSFLIQGSGIHDVDGAQRNIITLRSCKGFTVVGSPSLWEFWFSSSMDFMGNQFATLKSRISDVSSWISRQTTDLLDGVGGFFDTLTSEIVNQQEMNRDQQFTLNANISRWISDQTSVISSDFYTMGKNVSTWISNQTSVISSEFYTMGKNVSTWISNQTSSLTTSISSWGQSLKDSIDALPKRIAEELKALIVPADGAIESMATKSEALVTDRFGGVFEGAQIVDNWAGQLQAQAATQILTIPIVNMNILGTNFPIGGWEVDLVPEGFEIIFESVKIIIDILATAAFVNGIKSRLERTLEG